MTYKIYPSLTILLSLTFSYAACGSDQFFLNEDATKETLHATLPAIATDQEEPLTTTVRQDESTPHVVSSPSTRSRSDISSYWKYTQDGWESHYIASTRTDHKKIHKQMFDDLMAIK